MDCPIVQEFIPSYIDQELADDNAAQIDIHIENCKKCRKELQTQIGVHRLLSDKLERTPAPESLKQKILNRIAGQRVLKPAWLFKKMSLEVRPLTGLAIAALLVFSVLSRDIIDTIKRGAPGEPGTPAAVMTSDFSGVFPSTIELQEGVNATVVGRLVCIGCYLRDNFLVDIDCSLHGHHYGLLTNDGSLWSFAENAESEKIAVNKDLHGKIIQVDGHIYYNSHYIDVNKFGILEDEE